MHFYFWSNEHEPIHVHVRKGRATATFVIEPQIAMIESKGFKPQELRLAEDIIEQNKEVIITNRKLFFSNKK